MMGVDTGEEGNAFITPEGKVSKGFLSLELLN